MDKKVSPSKLQGQIDILPSKSFVHRYLIAAALADTKTQIIALSDAEDIHITAQVLRDLGAQISYKDGIFDVEPIDAKKIEREVAINCGESGSTLRFLLPVIAALGVDAKIFTKGRLSERPLGELVECLTAQGAKITFGQKNQEKACHDENTCTIGQKNGAKAFREPQFRVSQSIKAGDFNILGSVSSQYISGLMFALPLLKGDSKIIIHGGIASVDYINITRAVLSEFGIAIEPRGYGFFVKGGQKYVSPQKIISEGCWSNAAFFLAAGAINGDILVGGVNLNSAQGDKAILDILKLAGADVEVIERANADAGALNVTGASAEVYAEAGVDVVRVKKSSLNSFEFDCKDVPDIVPISAVLAAYATGTSQFKNIARLRDKESDRLKATTKLLQNMGIDTHVEGDTLFVQGGKATGGAVVDGFFDHRIVMSAAVAAIGASNSITISGAQAVAKSYPDFFGDLVKVGGVVDLTEDL